jgi:hypothetical protein
VARLSTVHVELEIIEGQACFKFGREPRGNEQSSRRRQDIASADALFELLARMGENEFASVFILVRRNLVNGPPGRSRPLGCRNPVKARSAASAACLGCKRERVMPVHDPQAK